MSMRESTQNFLIGVTSLVALGGMVYLLFQFGELDPWIHPRYALTIYTDNARGLRQGGVTEYNGVPIGVVHKVRISDEHPVYPVVIEVWILAEHRVPKTAVPYAMTALLGGSAILQLEAAPVENAQTGDFHPTDGSAVIEREIKLKIIEQLSSELDARMGPVLDALEAFKQLSKTYTGVGEDLGVLIADFQGVDGASLQSSLDHFNQVLSDVSKAMKLAQGWLDDDQIRADVREAVDKANMLIEQATDAIGEFSRLTDRLGNQGDALVKGLLQTSDDVSLTLEEVRRITRLAADGDGTMAQLLNNPDLYNSLDDAATRMERALISLQLYIEKVKVEGLNIDF